VDIIEQSAQYLSKTQVKKKKKTMQRIMLPQQEKTVPDKYLTTKML
jgi:hypothetical protein